MKCSRGERERSENVIADLEKLYSLGLENEGIELPANREQRGQLARMIYCERFKNKPLTIVCPACPDYSFHQDFTGRYVYDFKKLNDGISLNASLLLEKAPILTAGLLDCKVRNTRYLVALADIEANDQEILNSVSLEKEEFLARVKKSAERIAGRLVNYGDVGMMGDLLQEEDFFRASTTLSRLKGETIRGIALGRHSLYSRWFQGKGRSAVNGLYEDRTKEDIRKYLTFGFAAKRNGFIILEATAPQIAGLYNFGDGWVPEANLPPLPPIPVVMIETEY